MKYKLHAIFLYLIFPGIVLSWLCLIFPFHIWDSLMIDWYPEFKGDMDSYIRGIKNKWREK